MKEPVLGLDLDLRAERDPGQLPLRHEAAAAAAYRRRTHVRGVPATGCAGLASLLLAVGGQPLGGISVTATGRGRASLICGALPAGAALVPLVLHVAGWG